MPQQLFRTAGVQNGAGVHLRHDRQGDTAGDICLDKSGDDVRGRPLCRNDEVHACRTGFLCQTADRIFHFLGRGHHQVGKLVDNDYDLGHRLQRTVRLGSRGVVVAQIADAVFGEQVIPPLHLLHCPVQRTGSLFRVGDHWDQQVGNALIDGEFDDLRVDQDQLDFFRCGMV